MCDLTRAFDGWAGIAIGAAIGVAVIFANTPMCRKSDSGTPEVSHKLYMNQQKANRPAENTES